MNGYSSELNNIFLNRWTLDDVYRLELDEYVDSNRGSKDKSRFGSVDTFCYWVEFVHWVGRTSRRLNKNELAFTFPSKLFGRFGMVSSPKFEEKELAELYRLKKRDNKNADDVSDDTIRRDAFFYEATTYDDDLAEHGFHTLDQIGSELDIIYDSVNGLNGLSDSETVDPLEEEQTPILRLNGRIVRHDEEYLWLAEFGRTRNEAFQNIKSQVIHIIECSLKRDFQKILETSLPSSFAWKISHLYSGERITPIFRLSILERCARNLGYSFGSGYDFADLQLFLADRRPAQFGDSFQYARHLLWTISQNDSERPLQRAKQRRRAADPKSIEQQVRRAVESYTVDQRHNLIQNALHERLVARYGKSVVRMEENFVDIKLFEENRITFYEVKSDLSAGACIRNAFGQVLNYVFSDSDSREKKIVVVGQFPPTQEERLFIEFLKQTMSIDFEYEYVEI